MNRRQFLATGAVTAVVSHSAAPASQATEKRSEPLKASYWGPEYYGGEEHTTFTMENGGQTIELYDAVSGDWFRSEHLTTAVCIPPLGRADDVTASFENVETLDEFITAVNDTFGTVV